MAELNPQPLPPKIEIAGLTEAVTAAVLRAIEAQPKNNPLRNPRIICGIIAEPAFLNPVRGEG